MRAAGRRSGLFQSKQRTVLLPESLEELGLHKKVGGWEKRDRQAASFLGTAEERNLMAISCFVYSLPEPPSSSGRERGRSQRRAEAPTALLPQPFMRLPTGSSPGTENYLCLQIAFDSHELFLLPANRSGDGSYRACKPRIRGRQMKEQRSGSHEPWESVPALLLLWPLPPCLGLGLLICKTRGLSLLHGSDVPSICVTQKGTAEVGTCLLAVPKTAPGKPCCPGAGAGNGAAQPWSSRKDEPEWPGTLLVFVFSFTVVLSDASFHR